MFPERRFTTYINHIRLIFPCFAHVGIGRCSALKRRMMRNEGRFQAGPNPFLVDLRNRDDFEKYGYHHPVFSGTLFLFNTGDKKEEKVMSVLGVLHSCIVIKRVN